MSKPQLILFDCDGVLVDSEYIAAQVESELLTDAGYPISPEEIAERFAGLTWPSILMEIERESSIPISASLIEKSRKIMKERITKELLQLRVSIQHEELKPQQKGKIKCPKCAPGHIQLYDKVAQCDHYARGCDFKIWRSLHGVFLEEKEMKNLLEKGATSVLKSVQAKDGTVQDAALRFADFKVSIG